MRRYLLGRIMLILPLLLLVSLLTFGLTNLTPGDAALRILQAQGYEPTAEAVATLRAGLGLDLPWQWRYLHWLGQVLRGDLGISYVSGQPVAAELWQRWPATLALTLAALFLAALLALPIALLSARYRDTLLDQLTRAVAALAAALPGFWLGLLLLQWFAVELQWFPVAGQGDLRHLVLPALTLALTLTAVYVRLLRASLLEVMGQDFVGVLRAKGLGSRRILTVHGLRGALLPVLTAFGLSLGQLLSGSVMIETVFAWPGVGAYAVAAVFHRDYPALQGYALMITALFVCTNLAVDLGYRLLDPRIRLGGDTNRS